MSTEIQTFIYRDARGHITARSVANISESEQYIQGICQRENALRTFRKDRVLETISNHEQIAERLSYHISVSPPPDPDPIPRRTNTAESAEICFTGFKKADKQRLIGVAETAGFFVRDGVAKNLDFLCCGYNAGPQKIEQARHQGVVALSEQQFMSLVETGEVPE